jgi:hypothetical protein
MPRVPSIVDRWAVGSQQASRRNAMVALTALTQRRAERTEVEEFLAALHQPSRSEAAGSVAGARG